MRSLILTLFCIICFSVQGQVDSFQNSTLEYLNSIGTDLQFAETYDDLFDALQKQFTVPEVTETVWSELKEGKSESVQEALVSLTSVYRKYFTEAEIRDMAKFYKTEVAQKMILNSSDLLDNEKDQIETFYNSDLGKKIAAKNDALTLDIADVTRAWSDDLFAVNMSNLIKKGYSPHQ